MNKLPLLNFVIFNLQQLTRDKLLKNMVDVIQSLSEYGISIGLVSDKNIGETKALLETNNKSLFSLFDSVIYSASHLELNSYVDVMMSEFKPSESLIINPNTKDETQFTPVKYAIISPNNFNSDFAKVLIKCISIDYSIGKKSNIEFEDIVNTEVPVINEDTGEIALINSTVLEEAKDESIPV